MGEFLKTPKWTLDFPIVGWIKSRTWWSLCRVLAELGRTERQRQLYTFRPSWKFGVPESPACHPDNPAFSADFKHLQSSSSTCGQHRLAQVFSWISTSSQARRDVTADLKFRFLKLGSCTRLQGGCTLQVNFACWQKLLTSGRSLSCLWSIEFAMLLAWRTFESCNFIHINSPVTTLISAPCHDQN